MLENAKPHDIVKKSESRLAAVKALYANEINDEKQDSFALALNIISYYHDENKEHPLNEKFLGELLEGVQKNLNDIDASIRAKLAKDWNIERIGDVIRSILRAAIYELKYSSNIPYKVIINEYIEVAREFCDEKEVKFVNGILDKVAHEVREIE